MEQITTLRTTAIFVSAQKEMDYDIEPFRSYHTITQEPILKCKTIGPTTIPSPLAKDLDPCSVLEIKQLLTTGKGQKYTPFRRQNPNGTELWESWKRAWDLWNNHYIEGRVNPKWIKDQYPNAKANAGRRPRLPSEMEDEEDNTNVISGGGFYAMKSFEEYNFEIDITMNTAWRPRLRGETMVTIDMDDLLEDVAGHRRNLLEFFGGVDCGRSPYPVSSIYAVRFSRSCV